MTKLTNDFNGTQDERALIEQMRSVMSVEAAKETLEASGVLVPSVRDKDGTGYDIFSLLLKERIVMLNGQVEPAMAAVAIAQLKFLDATAPVSGADNTITVLINSPGGSVIDGHAIYDVMRSIDSPVRTVGLGMQASMGSILMAGGDERSMTPGSTLMIHSIASQTQGELVAQEISLEQTRRLFDQMKAIYIRHIGLNEQYWDLICARNTWLSADQALKMGFIDDIYRGKEQTRAAKKAPYEKSADDFLKAIQDKRDADVAGLSTQEIKDLFLGTSDKDGLGERRRAEAIVELSQRPEFWTEEKKNEKQVANDNAPKASAEARKKGPGLG